MHIKDIKLGWVTVSDIEKAEKFFIEKLGLKLIAQNDTGWREFKANDGLTLGVSKERAHHKAGQNAILTLEVNDIEATKKHLEEKGVQFKTSIFEVPGRKYVEFVDLDNNVFQLVQQL